MPARSVGEEVAHLIRARGFPPRRAVAASQAMNRAGKFAGRGKGRKKKRRSQRY